MDLTPEEQRLIEKALDLLLRVHLGQVSAVMQPLGWHLDVTHDGVYDWKMSGTELRSRCDDLSAEITGHQNGGPSIGNPGVAEEARDAYRLIAKLRGDKLGMTLFLKKENP